MKALKFVTGNLLLNKDVQVVGHQANCQNTFGSGIARSIREMYVEAYSADRYASQGKSNFLGNFSYGNIPIENDGMNRHDNQICRIYNLYGQNLGTDHSKRFDRKTDYEALYNALEGMKNHLSPVRIRFNDV